MKHLTRWIVIVPAGVLAIFLAIANRHTASVRLDPFSPQTPALAIEAPMFIILFAAIFIGILIGGMATWAQAGQTRRTARRWRRRSQHLEKEVERARPQSEAPSLPATRSE